MQSKDGTQSITIYITIIGITNIGKNKTFPDNATSTCYLCVSGNVDVIYTATKFEIIKYKCYNLSLKTYLYVILKFLIDNNANSCK